MTINYKTMKHQITQTKFLIPLEMRWKPLADITTHELAMCLPYFFGSHFMPNEIDKSQSHFRHFEITDHNKS